MPLATPDRPRWSLEKLRYERSVAMGFSLEVGTRRVYSSHVKSYFDFCKRHELPVEPTADTLSFFAVYMSHFIRATSVQSYLSGISHSLEPLYPGVRAARSASIVKQTIAGCIKRSHKTTSRKSPLTADDLTRMRDKYLGTGSYDDTLWLAVLYTGFNGLHRLGELVWPDLRSEQDFRKVIPFSSLRRSDAPCPHYSYHLPGHKGNRFFEGNTVMITTRNDGADAIPILAAYVALRNTGRKTRCHPALFVREDGSIPTRSWFMSRLRANFGPSYAGHSVRSGGATDLATRGIPDSIIQKMGRWSSDAFQIYIRKNPALLAVLAGFLPQ